MVEPEVADVSWALMEADDAGTVRGPLTGLHESVLGMDPTDREMRPRPGSESEPRVTNYKPPAMKLSLTVQLASLPDREGLVAEIFLGNDQVAEINQEGQNPIVEIYPNPQGGPWIISLSAFLSTLEEAAQRLLGSAADTEEVPLSST